MALLDDVKQALRITTDAFDGEVNDLIAAAQDDLVLSGVDPEKARAEEPDPLVKRAVVTYCKAHFGWDVPEAERLQQAYDLLKMHLTLSGDYAAKEA